MKVFGQHISVYDANVSTRECMSVYDNLEERRQQAMMQEGSKQRLCAFDALFPDNSSLFSLGSQHSFDILLML